MAYTQEDRYFYVTTPLGPDKLLLRSFYGEERISGLFQFNLEMHSEEADLDFAQLVGKSATITVELSDGSQRFINGIVGRFVQGGRSEGFAIYYADLHPSLWFLTMSADCKIFQQKSVPDILAAVFDDHGLTDYRNGLTGSYQPREYCVQYNETAFDFVSRLMEEEGIFYYFEHEDGKHTLVFADDPTAFAACAGGDTLQYGVFEQYTQQNAVSHCTLEENVIAGKAALDDFSFETPSTDLIASIDSGAARDGAKRRLYEYPGGFLKKDQGEDRAKVRIEECEAPQIALRGDSYAPALTSGYKFTLEGHYRQDVDRSYVLSRVTHNAAWDSYTNSFEAFPDDIPFRPPRITRKPLIAGTQTALVVGKSGEEIWTDEYGRVKVQFHWDQEGANDENSSCWIRVSHAWAGKAWGQISLPRIGQEVIVSFEEGDPDRPLITGRVYNSEQTVPYALPGEQTKSTLKSDSSKGGGGFNELRFEDKKDEEEIFFHAERDFNRVVQNNDTLKVGFEDKDNGDQTIEVHNDRTITVAEGNQKHQIEKGDRTLLIDTGKDDLTIKGNRSLTISQGDRTVKISMGKSSTEAMKSIELKVGANSILIDTQGVTIKGTMVTVQGTAKTDVKAPMTNVSGDGMLVLKGGLLKVN